jgi:hypothetical protein
VRIAEKGVYKVTAKIDVMGQTLTAQKKFMIQ